MWEETEQYGKKLLELGRVEKEETESTGMGRGESRVREKGKHMKGDGNECQD